MTPEQERIVRALLGDARETEPMPMDVAERLDDVLADLRSGRAASPVDGSTAGTVTSLEAAAARRRRTTRLVLAAAVVVVAGVGVGQAWRGSMVSGVASDSSAAGSAEKGLAQAPADEATPSTTSGNDGGAGPSVRADHLRADARALQPATSGGTTDSTSTSGSIPGCVLPDTGGGAVVAVTYEGIPAALVYRPAAANQVVDLYLCGATTPVRSVTLR